MANDRLFIRGAEVKAGTRNLYFVLILATPVDISSMNTKILIRLAFLQASERKRQHNQLLLAVCRDKEMCLFVAM